MSRRQLVSLEDKFLPAHQLAASLIDLAMSRGVDKNRLLRGTRIFYQDIKGGTTHLNTEQMLRLMANARSLVSGFDCSFQLGKRVFPGNYGAISNALLHCRNLQDALRVLRVHAQHICPFMHSYAYQDEQQYHLVIFDAVGCGEQWQFVLETYFSALVSATKLLLGHRIPFHFDFPFARPRYIQEYETNLGFRLNFSQSQLRIRFDLEWLKAPFAQQSQSLKRHALQHIRQHQPPYQGFIQAVRDSLWLKRQQTLQETALLFAMSPATFKRKLNQHGVRFQQIQDELGKQQALYLLQVQKRNNEDSASMMAFSDIPNFRRAVKRWTGLTPNQLRLG
ncbi:MAG: AraC family transcriptional regulator ligand-binding domain-containing protein [Paraglaciecola sp.]|uniref:AraC family transcriptional regulator n=1 Tax=Paraglaciecola sp. TaxID=1920173 RepID=UPI00273FE9CF|nr:AraC family transcriptional regulator ligand-binding domain-containing protein [Paraglaciecola sp.]MDP5033088.1 AraC family transcriptional regulator ligand-binding domain-containing protein [Paraglaciecola sp.]MDP5130159.1 AraC family transcriptional regulator ligand-binding domain-containing protein [Paraglaciecola sp.]